MFLHVKKIYTPGDIYTDQDNMHKLEKVYLYKIEESVPKVEKHKDNLMLFHGTNFEGVSGILQSGFRNSASGKFGSGVYLTESEEVAFSYCDWQKSFPNTFWFNGQKINCNDGSKNVKYLLLNEVLNSDVMKTVTFNYQQRVLTGRQKRNVFTKNAHVSSPQPTEDDYIRDEEGRLYRNNRCSEEDEFVADASIVKPRYLFVLITEYCNSE